MIHMLIGCSKKKRVSRFPIPVEEVYLGQLFRLRVKYAERRNVRWSVLSSKYGLLEPDRCIKHYDEKITDQCRLNRAAWPLVVANQWLSLFDDDDTDPREHTVELHCGKDYAHPLAEHLALCGVKVVLPVKGLGIGQQLSWYQTEIAKAERRLEVQA